MRKIQNRSMLILLLTLAFFAGIVYHITNLSIHASEWASMPINGHIADTTGLDHAGTIYDRNGVILAQSVNGKRIYNEDETTRRACLHVVGDDSINISTAVQTAYRSELGSYNIVFGLGLPESLKKGSDLTLTIDSKMQKAAYEALGSNRGAVVVYNYKTGEILCLASTPAYDPENIPDDIETNDEYEGAYINRCVSATYPPGSTFKLVTAAAALNNVKEAENSTYDCQGSAEIGGKEVTCYEISGLVDMKQAMCESCNLYFGQYAVNLGKDAMTRQAEAMGFNKNITYDGIETAKSVYNVKNATTNDLAWSGVGQYTVLESPLNMAMISASIANGGKAYEPYILKTNPNPLKFEGHKTKTMLDSKTASMLYEMMDYTAANNYGKSSFSDTLDVCAKTGTAEVDEGGAHAWVTGFCKDEDHPLAFAVIVEHGDSGYRAAVPVAASVLAAVA